MKEKIEDFLRSLASALQLAKMYGCGHPEFDKGLSKAYQELEFILNGRKELLLAVISGELTSGDDIFFDLSRQLVDFIDGLVEKGFEKIGFKKNISKQELKEFFAFFSIPESENIDLKNYFESKNISNIEIGKIESSVSGRSEKGKAQFQKLPGHKYSESISNLSLSLTSFLQGRFAGFANFGSIVASLMKMTESHYQEILRLSKLKGKDVVTFAHILNVSLLAICFSRKLEFSESECSKIGMAALFHDVGKLYVSSEVLKGGRLDGEGFEKMKNHTLLGAKILLDYVDKIGKLPVVVALEHHLMYDLKGYPKLKFFRRPHIVSMIVALCDAYDALNQRRSYKTNYPSEDIYKIMKEGKGSQFDPELFEAFFRFIGVWPNGTVVLLNNQKVAIVKDQNQDDIFAPKVEVVSDSTHEVIDLKENNKGIEIQKSLNPYKEGKKYLDLE